MRQIYYCDLIEQHADGVIFECVGDAEVQVSMTQHEWDIHDRTHQISVVITAGTIETAGE
jgi:hypothetical protein